MINFQSIIQLEKYIHTNLSQYQYTIRIIFTENELRSVSAQIRMQECNDDDPGIQISYMYYIAIFTDDRMNRLEFVVSNHSRRQKTKQNI